MTKMLNVLESFLNFHGHRYLRLDGTTKVLFWLQIRLMLLCFTEVPLVLVFMFWQQFSKHPV